ncbi:MAG: heparinase II/III family protein [Planctomycetota bacterium]|nr:heparinase II/III family protein [Planctomycetota bacterium]
MPAATVSSRDPEIETLPVPDVHPRLFGSRDELKALANSRADSYAKLKAIAADASPAPTEPENRDLAQRIVALSLVAAVDGDREAGRKAVELVLTRFIDQPVRTGHVRFGADVAYSAIPYDLCHECWTDAERKRFFTFMDEAREQNRGEEPSVFHNGWYGYKMWGFGMGALATWHKNPAARRHLREVDEEYRARAMPALKFSGAGGGFGEGYYVHYWLFEWLIFCECLRRNTGLDYYALAPEFYAQRAVACMFEMLPTIREDGTRRPVPMGDGGGRPGGPDRDRALASRRLLVNYYKDDPAHKAVAAFDAQTPRAGYADAQWFDFFYRDENAPRADLAGFKRSHFSPGPGHWQTRSSWDEDAAYLYFHCGKHFTAHQHLDQGHFVLWKHAMLLDDGGHYCGWSEPHIVNCYIRSIEHNTLLIHDPRETWPAIRLAKEPPANDGGQRFPGFACHHNGGAWDVAQWETFRDELDTAKVVACEDPGAYSYVAGDLTNAYAKQKVERVWRQILFLRPGTFVICDHVVSTDPSFRKTFLLQPATIPVERDGRWVVTNGPGRLFIQTLEPAAYDVKLYHGDNLYGYNGGNYPNTRDWVPTSVCRMEVIATQPAREDLFVHVLTATGSSVADVPKAEIERRGGEVAVRVDGAEAGFRRDGFGGWVTLGGVKRALAHEVRAP